MCGFLVYKNSNPTSSSGLQRVNNNFYIQKRGTDFTNTVEINGYTFVHNLLSITGDFTLQPFINGNIVCVYNGEIYNHRYLKSDGENIIPLYKKYGSDFPKYLDGEWAIALYDFDREIAIFATDLFATKPIWRNGLECASYESGVGGTKIPANTIEIVSFDGNVKTKSIYKWDLNQHKNTYNDWITAFENAVKKRYTKNCFIGLSSGYDSGAICCALLKEKLPFRGYLISGNEDKQVLKERMALLTDYEYIDTTDFINEEKEWLSKNVERFRYKVKQSIHTDSASLALSRICRLAHSEGRKVYLSGQGGDEIIGDYALKPHQSSFGGKFPETIPPTLWQNFYDGYQYSYLGKEEYVAGSHAIETRYPFLDKQVVQEFLWLTPNLKNKHYKAPIHEYLEKNNFPNLYNKKIGLRVKNI
jgi:asparagine synthetase B (glutamine-hydrolysing)